MNPCGIHHGPRTPFAKALRMNPFGIHTSALAPLSGHKNIIGIFWVKLFVARFWRDFNGGCVRKLFFRVSSVLGMRCRNGGRV